MGYALVYTDVAREDIEKLKKSGDKDYQIVLTFNTGETGKHG